MTIHRDTRQVRQPMRRETPVDLLGGGGADCPEVHELSIPGHHADTDGTIELTYSIIHPNDEAEEPEPVDIVVEIDHDGGAVGILADFLAAALALDGDDPLLTEDNFDVQGGPLPSAIYFIFSGNLSNTTIALPVVTSSDLTGSPIPTPIVRKASAYNWSSFSQG